MLIFFKEKKNTEKQKMISWTLNKEKEKKQCGHCHQHQSPLSSSTPSPWNHTTVYLSLKPQLQMSRYKFHHYHHHHPRCFLHRHPLWHHRHHHRHPSHQSLFIRHHKNTWRGQRKWKVFHVVFHLKDSINIKHPFPAAESNPQHETFLPQAYGSSSEHRFSLYSCSVNRSIYNIAN